MSEINQIRELLHQKADLQARINLIPYDGTPEVKKQGDKQYLYMRKRVGVEKPLPMLMYIPKRCISFC